MTFTAVRFCDEKRNRDYFAAVVLAAIVATAVAVMPALHPSPRKSAHSSQEVPLVNVHMPYWPPSVLVLISVLPPIAPQLTDAGFARPTAPGAAVAAVVVTAMVCVWVATGAGVVCWVHPEMNRAATTQAARRIKTLVFDIIKYQNTFIVPLIKM
jgi:hypothetical protein